MSRYCTPIRRARRAVLFTVAPARRAGRHASDRPRVRGAHAHPPSNPFGSASFAGVRARRGEGWTLGSTTRISGGSQSQAGSAPRSDMEETPATHGGSVAGRWTCWQRTSTPRYVDSDGAWGGRRSGVHGTGEHSVRACSAHSRHGETSRGGRSSAGGTASAVWFQDSTTSDRAEQLTSTHGGHRMTRRLRGRARDEVKSRTAGRGAQPALYTTDFAAMDRWT